ncbi:MAG: hypothetical protein KDA93_19620 [Planctomycetaceae bacterium]|nr:hypothetical protein [Planctomycetaceae bacterium]
MSEDNESFAKENIHNLVWSGFYTTDEIIQIVFEDIFDGEMNRKWITTAVHEEVKSKSNSESDWPAQTDCDRLDFAFDQLNETGIVALQNAGYTQSDGVADVSDEYHQRGGPKSSITGYCFYHGQDLERAVNGEGLLLAFGDMNGIHARGIEVGQKICDTLRAAGFIVEWDGSIGERVAIPDINWQRRYSTDRQE